MSPSVPLPTGTKSSDMVSNPVTWPSVFWALVPVALNSMTQPAGSLSTSLTTDQSFYFRVSPVICFVDALSVLFNFIYYARCSSTWRLAIARVSKAKLTLGDPSEDRSTANEGSEPVGNLRRLQENELFRLILFSLGALPQIIKIFACSGLVWVKVWVAVYLTSFILIEVLVLGPLNFGTSSYAGENGTFEAEQAGNLDENTSRRVRGLTNLWHRWYPGIAMLSQTPLALVATMLWLHLAELYGKDGTLPGAIAITVMIIYELLPSFYADETSTLFSLAALFWVLTTNKVAAIWTFQKSEQRAAVEKITIQSSSFSIMLEERGEGIIRLLVGFLFGMFLRIVSPGQRRSPLLGKRYNTWIGRITFLLHLAVALVYCLTVYDSEATGKPGWVEYLG